MDRTNIVLTGFMYSGKTSVGRIISDAKGIPLEDTDSAVEKAAGKSIPEIFEQDGEPVFRAMEREAVARAAGRAGAVIALGGGAVLDEGNVADAGRSGVLYFLRVSLGEALDRAAGASGRPLMDGKSPEEVGRLMAAREALYLDVTDVVVETEGKTPEEVAQWIMDDFDRRARGGAE